MKGGGQKAPVLCFSERGVVVAKKTPLSCISSEHGVVNIVGR